MRFGHFSLFLCSSGLHFYLASAFLLTVHRCGDPPVVNHAQTSYGDHEGLYAYNVTYTCNAGYQLIGTGDTIECVCTGLFGGCHFRGDLPVCKKEPQCIKLPHPPHGHVTYDGHMTAHYSCSKDYVLIGPITRHCDENGQWIGQEPKCDAVPRHEQLRCRACDRVKHLDQCHRVITCRANEECYTEHIINDVTRLSVFTSGCRPKQECLIPSNVTSWSEVVNCTECCADMNATLGCNSDLCSFREKSGGNSTYCVQCELENSIEDCNNITACDSSQMCVSSTVISGADVKVSAGCYSAKGFDRRERTCPMYGTSSAYPWVRYANCTSKTRGPLAQGRSPEMRFYNRSDFLQSCQNLIKALIDSENAGEVTQDNRRDIIHTCDMCCGDDGCNDDTCVNVKAERLAYLYQQGELDLETLKVNRTSPNF